MPKHKVIAQTWAKRKDFEDKGRLSITLYNTHTDPVGLNFDVNDLNSSETNDISSTWAAYLPQCVKRRMALTGAAAAGTGNSSSHGPRKNSLDSEISVSVRHVSVESRRNSVDSQVSVKIAEMKTKVASRSRGKHGGGGGGGSSNKRTQRRRDYIAAATGRSSRRRESSTSVESQVIALKKTTYPNASHKVDVFAHHHSSKKQQHSSYNNNSSMKRRTANAGLDPSILKEFLQKNGEFIFPFLQNQDMSSSSEEENSRASLKIQDLNVVVKQQQEEEEEEVSEDGGIQIEELPNSKQVVLENFLKNMKKSNESNGGGNRHSRNSARSRQSRKSRKSHPKTTGLELDFKRDYARDRSNDSLSCSSVELDVALDVGSLLNSSFSGMSMGKPQSRNSKTSCDVGIQANPFELVPTYGDEELQQAMRLLNAASRQRNEAAANDDGGTELQSLLGLSQRHHREPTFMSESDKLKMLLLPSK